jgi:mannobiose 2-epimerase
MVAGSAAPLDPALRNRLQASSVRLRRLADEVMTFWKEKGPDPTHGGFFATLDRKGAPTLPTDKGIIQQSRHLWAFSNWYELREPTPAVKAIADQTYEFVTRHFWDPSTNQFHYKINQNGTTVVDARKILYAQAFAIYALSTYGRVFQVPVATGYALETFRALEARHDPTDLGYDEHNDSGWLQPGASKSTNTHLHLMEAFTSLYQTSGDGTVRARLEELASVVIHKIFQPKLGYDAQEFTDQWQPVGKPSVSYGHDLETAWLLAEAARVLGHKEDTELRHAILAMGATSAEQGFDTARGGYFEAGIPQASATMTDKIWWVQSEALPALLLLYQLTQDSTYLDRFESTLDFIQNQQQDQQYPGTEWFYGITLEGQINSRGTNKGEEWKASYHNSRALTVAERWIRQALGH